MLTTALLFVLGISSLFSQTDSSTKAQINLYYQLALQYKNGKNGEAINYHKAYVYFLKAARLGDAQSIYAVAYLHYKGLGCEQDYNAAAKMFAQGAAKNQDNSLYFYGLCWRNGYGVTKNEDSAKYYLQRSADLGYKLAMMELQTPTAENSNDSAARVLIHRINNAAIPAKTVLNQFNKIQPHLPASDVIEGEYSGWLIQYDWSGNHIIASKKLQLNISAQNKSILGEWVEEGADTAKIQANIIGDQVAFERTAYARKDHYSVARPIPYDFKDAKLNIVQQGDSVYIAGNVAMFSSLRGEPAKPMFVALSRAGLKSGDSSFWTKVQLNAYPNPFSSLLNVEFYLPHSAKVSVQLYDMNGVQRYHKEAGKLEEGHYALPVYASNLIQGSYLLQLHYDNRFKTIKVIKQ